MHHSNRQRTAPPASALFCPRTTWFLRFRHNLEVKTMNQPIVRNLIFSLSTLLASTCHLSATVLSNNLNQPVSFTELVDPTTRVAAGFGTGNYSSTLLNVQLLIQLDGQVNPMVWLYKDQAGAPGTAVGSLALAQPPSGPGLATVLFSGQNLPLAPNSTYWIVGQSLSGSWEWAYTGSNVGSGPGFQHTWGVSQDGGNWFVSDIEPMIMSVQDAGPATPEPGTFVLLGVGALGLSLVKRRKTGKSSVQ